MYFATSDGCGIGLDKHLHEIKGCYGCELPKWSFISFTIMLNNTWFVRLDENIEFSDKLECPINNIQF